MADDTEASSSAPDQSAAETSRLGRMEAFAASNSGGSYFGGSDSAGVADSSVAPDQSAAETSRLGRMEAASPAGGYFGGYGGVASAAVKASTPAPTLKQVKSFIQNTLAILGAIANPPRALVGFAIANMDKMGQPNPYGTPQFTAGEGGRGIGYISAIPAPNSFAAQQIKPAVQYGSSYIETGSNFAPTSTKQAQGGALAALAVVALAIAS